MNDNNNKINNESKTGTNILLPLNNQPRRFIVNGKVITFPIPIKQLIKDIPTNTTENSPNENKRNEICSLNKKPGINKDMLIKDNEETKEENSLILESLRPLKVYIPNDNSISEENHKGKNKNNKLKNLQRVLTILIAIFNGEKVNTKTEDLKDYEAEIIKEFLLRKDKGIKKTEEFRRFQNPNKKENLYLLIKHFEKEESKKRLEENIKLIFNLTMKQLKKDFQANKKLFTTFCKIDPIFFQYYFEETAERWRLDYSLFYNPLIQKKNRKNLKHNYIKRLFLSDRFRRDFFSYIESGRLLRYYEELIPYKLFNILTRFDFYFDAEKNFDKGLELIRRYFRNNKQCKMPWTRKEVDNGITDLIATFKNPNK